MVRPIHLRILGHPKTGKSTAAALLYACLVDRASAMPPEVRYYMDVASLRVASALFRHASATPQGSSVEGADSFSLNFVDPVHTSSKGSSGEEGIPLSVETQNIDMAEGSAPRSAWPLHPVMSSGNPPIVANLWIIDARQLKSPGEEMSAILFALRSFYSHPKESHWFSRTDRGPLNMLLLTKWDMWDAMDLPPGHPQVVPPPVPHDTEARQRLLAALLTRAGLNGGSGPAPYIPPQVPLFFSGKVSASSEAQGGTVFERFLAPYSVREYMALLALLAVTARS
jgi:hypothetical protein